MDSNGHFFLQKQVLTAGGSQNLSYTEKTSEFFYEIQQNFKMSHDEFMGLYVAVVIMIHFLVVKLVELLHLVQKKVRH